jgi:hypothetical protein
MQGRRTCLCKRFATARLASGRRHRSHDDRLDAISAKSQQVPQEELPPGIYEVTPQGWLDPPNVPVEGALPGTARQQVIIDTYIAQDSAFIARPDSFGESVLPRGRGPNINLRTID